MSIFHLKTDVKEIESSNNGVLDIRYNQLSATRDVTENNFSNGPIHIKFSNDSNQWWVPARSYIRARLSLTKADGVTPLTMSDQIAPAMGLMSNLFSGAEFRINGKTVSRVSDYMPEIDALKSRMNKTESWLKSVGASVNFWDADFQTRCAAVSSDGKLAQEADTVQSETKVARTALGDGTTLAFADATTIAYDTDAGTITVAAGGAEAIPDLRLAFPVGSYIYFTANAETIGYNVPMRVLSHASALVMSVEAVVSADIAAAACTTNEFGRLTVGEDSAQAGKFELIWQPPLSIFEYDGAIPQGQYELVLRPQQSAQYKYAAVETKTPKTPGTDYEFSVDELYLYANQVLGPQIEDNMTYLLELEDIACQAESNLTSSLQQKNFNVSPSTRALTLAFQNSTAGTVTNYSGSKFTDDGKERRLTRMYFQYANRQFPSPDADPSDEDGTPSTVGTNYVTQLYVDSLLGNGAFHSQGEREDLQKWKERGVFYHYPIAKAPTDRSTRVQVNAQFATGTDVSSMRALLFSHYRSVAAVNIADGEVKSVILQEV